MSAIQVRCDLKPRRRASGDLYTREARTASRGVHHKVAKSRVHDNLGNILNLLPFEMFNTRDGRRFECKFTEIIAMANVASMEAGGAEAEAEAVVQ